MLNHFQHVRVRAKKVLPNVSSIRHRIFLVLTVHNFAHAFDELTIDVIVQKRIPVRSPDDLNHVPASPPKGGFQFLNNLAVASYWPVKSLQIAVNDPGQVVEIFTRCQCQRAKRFGFVAFPIAKIGPDAGFGRIDESAMFHVPQKSGLIDRTDRAQPHGHCRELPEGWHQPRMRVAGQASAGRQLTSEVVEMFFGQAAFKERS